MSSAAFETAVAIGGMHAVLMSVMLDTMELTFDTSIATTRALPDV